MTTRISLSHHTDYEYDRPVSASTHLVRLRPAPHTRVPIQAYSMTISPKNCFTVWQQDPFGNFIANVHFPEKISKLSIAVDLIAELTAINPLDFVINPYAEHYPFEYEKTLFKELKPYITKSKKGPLFSLWLEKIRLEPSHVLETLVSLNRLVNQEIGYTIRLEPGIQSCDQTLKTKRGSCRDLAWMLLQTLRHFRFAARFVSGYLIQLKSGSYFTHKQSTLTKDFVDLHAWVEVYLPGAGWVGLDPTSGYFTSECHIPLSCTPEPESAAPVVGFTDICKASFDVRMDIKRLDVAGPLTFCNHYSDHVWRQINKVALEVDAHLLKHDVRMTMGGEPTFIASDNQDAQEWQTCADGQQKFERAQGFLRRLQARWGKGGVLYQGQGKFYAGEELPRWVLSCFWLKDQTPLWQNLFLLANGHDRGHTTLANMKLFSEHLAHELGLDPSLFLPVYEDLALKAIQQGLNFEQETKTIQEPFALILPVAFNKIDNSFKTEKWSLERKNIYALAGTSAAGFRLPLSHVKRSTRDTPKGELPTALCLEVRRGNLYVFIPPTPELRNYCFFLKAIENASAKLAQPVIIEGYAPPDDPNLGKFHITPDPGVLEVNISPAANWGELERTIHELYEEAKATHLTAERFLVDGRHVGTGGGNHITIGGATLSDSPILRRPDLLQSLLTYNQHHPSLSYFFSGLFVGPTSQAPRIDESRHEKLYELEVAFAQLSSATKTENYWWLDRLLRNLLTDNTGNGHRVELSIDKLYAPTNIAGRQGLIELRGYEMMPHPHMCLLQMLVVRALVSYLWQKPYKKSMVRWGSELHDKFMLPYFLYQDFREVLKDLTTFGYAFKEEWFLPFLDFRFPRYGKTRIENIDIELRMALEPWDVLGEENVTHQTSRMVDNTNERLQILVKNLTPGRYIITCNQRRVPLHATNVNGEFVAGIRFKARNLVLSLHPHLPVNTPLIFDIYDSWHLRSVGGFTYYSDHPGGINYHRNPSNAVEAESRMTSRFVQHGYNPRMKFPAQEPVNPEFLHTLDLRRPPLFL